MLQVCKFPVIENSANRTLMIILKAASADLLSSLIDALTFTPERDVFYWLYTQKSQNGVKITPNLSSVNGSTFNSSVPLRIIIHGFLSNQNSEDIVKVRKAYLQRGNFNVVSSHRVCLNTRQNYSINS